jgi:hypothetical protein
MDINSLFFASNSDFKNCISVSKAELFADKFVISKFFEDNTSFNSFAFNSEFVCSENNMSAA